MISREFLMEEVMRCENIIKKSQSKLTSKPKGWIRTRIYNSGNKVVCYCEYDKNNNIKRKILDLNKKTDRIKEERIRNYDMLLNQISNMTKYVKRLKTLLKTIDSISMENDKLIKKYSFAEKMNMNDLKIYSSTDNNNWIDIKERQNSAFEENLKYKGVGGYYRSKSEASISQELFRKNINFKYEVSIFVDNQIIYPDFLLLTPLNNTFVIWEHFGKMDDAQYRKKAFRKIELYDSIGYHLNRNLIITYETLELPFTESNMKSIMEMIRYM